VTVKLRALPAFVFLCVFCASSPSGTAAARAEEPEPLIDVLRVTTKGSEVFLRFHLRGAINPELARKIEAGLETTIRYEIRMYRQYRYWFDNFLDSRHYSVSATFDPVTREYVVAETLDDKPLSRTTTADFEDVKRLLVSKENLFAFHVSRDWPQRNLIVHMRAAFDSGYLFAFIPVDYRTSWKKSKKFAIGSAAEGP
jgi:Domain of unknown function (DUF4390)